MIDSTRLPTPLGRAAVDYALRGLPVFPLQPRSKRPATTHGFKDATLDLDQIARSWTRTPHANIGMPTGEPSGIYVVDIDGAEGHRTWAALFPDEGHVPNTTRVATGREGGVHLWFRVAGTDAKLPNADLGWKLDTRGFGGYVLLPPSVHPNGSRYRLIEAFPPAPLPDYLRRAVTPPPPAPPSPIRIAARLPDGEITDRGRRRMLGVIRRLEQTQPGQRHAGLYWAARMAGGMVDAGMVSRDVAQRALFAAADAIGLVAEDGANVTQTISDGLQKGGAV